MLSVWFTISTLVMHIAGQKQNTCNISCYSYIMNFNIKFLNEKKYAEIKKDGIYNVNRGNTGKSFQIVDTLP